MVYGFFGYLQTNNPYYRSVMVNKSVHAIIWYQFEYKENEEKELVKLTQIEAA